MNIPSVTPDALISRLSKPHNLMDLRPMPAFNGWPLQGEAKGGHIPGSIALPLDWLQHFNPERLNVYLRDRGLRQDARITLIGYRHDRLDQAAELLAKAEFGPLEQLEGGWEAWVADDQRPIDQLAHYEELVYPDWLAAELASSAAKPATIQVGHVNFDAQAEYAAGHLPGAIYLDTQAFEDADTHNRLGQRELVQAIQRYGLRPKNPIVLYGRDNLPNPDGSGVHQQAGQIAAMRLAMILRAAGMPDVRVLDGGLEGWVRAGYELDLTIHEPQAAPTALYERLTPQDVFIDTPALKDKLEQSGFQLVSIRTWEEYRGTRSGYDYIERSGHIPGAIWGQSGSDAYHMQHYRSPANTMRPYTEIAANWQAAALDPAKTTAFYCGTGWRASEAYFYAHLMGWPRAHIYDGGWFEWSQDPNNPVSQSHDDS
jgi:thiosulfate/3-mercaptopyruvate sulfurtransferase